MRKRTTTEDPQDPNSDDARQGNGPQSANDVEHVASAVATSSSRGTHSQQKRSWRLDRSLFIVVCIVLGVLMLLLCAGLYVQYSNYRDAIAYGRESGEPIDHASVISYSRALDFAIAKTTALFLAFALVFIGTLYVLRIGEADYKLAAGTNAGKGSFQTSSPGLVMVTLGVFLISLVLYAKSAVDYSRMPREGPQVAALDSSSSSGDVRQSTESEPPPLSRTPPQSSNPTDRR